MKIWNFIRQYKKVIGYIWAISTTVISLWLGFYPPEQNPKLTFIQKGKFDAFTVEKSISDLQILLNGKDIRKDDLNIKVYKFKLINNGKRDIKESDFVQDIPFGLKVGNGKLARVSFGKTNSYVLENALKKTKTQDSLSFNFGKFYIGKEEYVMLDVWVIHKKDQEPKLSTFGRIADTEIHLTEEDEENDNSWYDLFKVIVVFVVIFGGGWLLFYTLSFIMNFIEKTYRLIVVKRKLDHHYDDSNKYHRLLVKVYTLIGRRKFIEVFTILLNSNETEKKYSEEQKNNITVNHFFELYEQEKITLSTTVKKTDYRSDFLMVINLLEESNMLEIRNDHELIIKPEFINEITTVLKLV